MGQAPPPPPFDHDDNDKPPLRRDIRDVDVQALIEENAQLRRLVIQLSKLVVRNAIEHR